MSLAPRTANPIADGMEAIGESEKSDSLIG